MTARGWALNGTSAEDDSANRAPSDSSSALSRAYRFGYCLTEGCPYSDTIWASGFQESPTFELPLALLSSSTQETHTLRACVGDLYMTSVKLTETCVTKELVVPMDATNGAGGVDLCEHDCLSMLHDLSRGGISQSFGCISRATTACSKGASSEDWVEEQLLEALDWIGTRLKQLPVDAGTLSSSIQAIDSIATQHPSAAVLTNAVAAIRVATSSILSASYGDAEDVRAFGGSSLRVLGSAEGKYQEASRQSSCRENTAFVSNSQFSKDRIGDAMLQGIAIGETITVATEQLRQLFSALDTSVIQDVTFSISAPESADAADDPESPSPTYVVIDPEVDVPGYLMEACNLAADLCPQPLVISISYVVDSTYLLLAMGKEVFVEEAAEYAGISDPTGLDVQLVSGQIGVELPSLDAAAGRSLLGTTTTLHFPVDLQVAGAEVKEGKLCARIDYETLRPEILSEANHSGTVATCEIDAAGDYVVLQLARKLTQESGGDAMRLKNPAEFYADLLEAAPDSSVPLMAIVFGVAFGSIAAAGTAVLLFRRFYHVAPDKDDSSASGRSTLAYQERYQEEEDDEDVEANLLAKQYARPLAESPEKLGSARWSLPVIPTKRGTEETQTLIQPINHGAGAAGGPGGMSTRVPDWQAPLLMLGDEGDSRGDVQAASSGDAEGNNKAAEPASGDANVFGSKVRPMRKKMRSAAFVSMVAAAGREKARDAMPAVEITKIKSGDKAASRPSILQQGQGQDALVASSARSAAAAIAVMGANELASQKQTPRKARRISSLRDLLECSTGEAAPAGLPDDSSPEAPSSLNASSESLPSANKLRGAAKFRAAAKAVVISIDQINKHSDGGWKTFNSVQDVPLVFLPIGRQGVPDASAPGEGQGGPEEDRQQQPHPTDPAGPSQPNILGYRRSSSGLQLFQKLRRQDGPPPSLQGHPKSSRAAATSARRAPVNGEEPESGGQKFNRRLTWSFGRSSSVTQDRRTTQDSASSAARMLMRSMTAWATRGGDDDDFMLSTDSVQLAGKGAALVQQAFGRPPTNNGGQGLWKDVKTAALVDMHAEGVRDKKGRSALHLAARQNNTVAIRAILDKCEDAFDATDMPDHVGRTPIHLAAEAGSSKAIRELLGHEVVTERMKQETRIFQRRSRFVNDPSLARHADVRGVNARDRAGNTALHLAAAHGHVKVIKALQETCELELDVDVQNKKGWTPMQIIASRKDTPLAAAIQLLFSNPDLELTYRDGDTETSDVDDEGPANKKLVSRRKQKTVSSAKSPLHLASLLGRPELVKAMLDHLRLQELAADHRGFRPQTSAAHPPVKLSSSDDIGVAKSSNIEPQLEAPAHRPMTAPDFATSFNSVSEIMMGDDDSEEEYDDGMSRASSRHATATGDSGGTSTSTCVTYISAAAQESQQSLLMPPSVAPGRPKAGMRKINTRSVSFARLPADNDQSDDDA